MRNIIDILPINSSFEAEEVSFVIGPVYGNPSSRKIYSFDKRSDEADIESDITINGHEVLDINISMKNPLTGNINLTLLKDEPEERIKYAWGIVDIINSYTDLYKEANEKLTEYGNNIVKKNLTKI